MVEKNLTVKWTVSRGRDTYGYTICTLYVDGVKAARCNGGGYDMQGTVLGHWLAAAYPDRLRLLHVPYYGLTFHDPHYDPGQAPSEHKDADGRILTVAEAEKLGLSLGLERYQAVYSGSNELATFRHSIPSIGYGIGISAVETIAHAIGIHWRKVHTDRKTDVWICRDELSIKREAVNEA